MRLLMIVVALLGLGYFLALNWDLPSLSEDTQDELSYVERWRRSTGCTDEQLDRILKEIQEEREADPDWDGNMMIGGGIVCMTIDIPIDSSLGAPAILAPPAAAATDGGWI